MPEADDAFEHARRAFRNASEALTIQAMRNYVTLGLAYLDRAEEMSAVVETPRQRAPASVRK